VGTTGLGESVARSRLFTVKIVARTNRGSRTVSVRRYTGCAKTRPVTRVRRHHGHR
jgi:hypothetical protein